MGYQILDWLKEILSEIRLNMWITCHIYISSRFFRLLLFWYIAKLAEYFWIYFILVSIIFLLFFRVFVFLLLFFFSILILTGLLKRISNDQVYSIYIYNLFIVYKHPFFNKCMMFSGRKKICFSRFLFCL